MRIAVGGFHHETNTFAPTKASFEMFRRADGWPGLCRGEAVLADTAGINLPIAGFLEAARASGRDFAPLAWANASPSAEVERDAYERIAGMMVDDLRAAGPVDAVYLDLHGAMVAEHLEDGEGELLRRVRAVIGPDIPLVASLDLHANISPPMADRADALVVFRTYPHVDMAETGARTARLLERILAEGRPAKAFRQVPFLIPLTAQCTLVEPAASLYAGLEERERGARCAPCRSPAASRSPTRRTAGRQRLPMRATSGARPRPRERWRTPCWRRAGASPPTSFRPKRRWRAPTGRGARPAGRSSSRTVATIRAAAATGTRRASCARSPPGGRKARCWAC